MADGTYTYLIYLSDPVQYASLNGQYPNGIPIPPAQAAVQFGAHFNDGISIPPYIAVIPGDADIPIQNYYNIETFTATPYSSSSPPVTLSWVGYFMLQGGGATPSVPATPILGQRRFIDGFELPGLGEGASNLGTHTTRASSRTSEGIGFSYRKIYATSRLHTIPAAMQGHTSWERFYIRILTYPTGSPDSIWMAKGSSIAGNAAVLVVNTSGQLVGYSKGNNPFPGNLLGTTPQVLALNTWYRVDIYIHFRQSGAGAEHGQMLLFINGSLAFSGNAPDGDGGLGTSQNHTTSFIGCDANQPVGSNGLEADFDDWISANDVGGALNASSVWVRGLPGFDLTSGSHVAAVRGFNFGSANSPTWSGDWRETNSLPGDNLSPNALLTSSTASAPLQVQVDGSSSEFSTPSTKVQIGGNGIAAAVIAAFVSNRGADTTGGLEISVGGSVFTASGLTITSGVWTSSLLYSVADNTKISDVPTTVEYLSFIKAATANTVSIGSLDAAVEIVGCVYGPEDSPNAVTTLPRIGIHNSPYPLIIQSNSVMPPISPVALVSGTYTGNSLAQDVLMKVPAHWFWVRQVGAVGGFVWYSSMTAAHPWTQKGAIGSYMPRAQFSQLGNCRVSVAGADANTNLAASTYYWTAFSDAGMRYLINGGFAHFAGVASGTNLLIDSGFTPDAAFFLAENIVSDATIGHYYKGVGHSGDTASPLNGAAVSSIATMATGTITSGATINRDNPQTAFSAWRKDDGGGNTGVVDVTSYTGDGGASKVIPLVLGGRTPGFVMVVPHNGQSFFRDLGHTGVNSQNIAGTNTTTGITDFSTANQITVGLAVNALGVVYDVFAIANGAFPTVVRPTPGPWTATGPVIPTIGQGCASDITQPSAGGGLGCTVSL